MAQVNFIVDYIYVRRTRNAGRGVFTRSFIQGKTVIERSPVIVMNAEDRKLLDRTLLHDYIFEWGDKKQECCMALGYVPLYNHSYQSNCEYEMDFTRQLITIRTVRNIKAGEELKINYNGDWNNETPVWFNAQ